MRIAVYTLTRERVEYTKVAFAFLRERAGYPYDHFVVDNGSQDGTREWLTECLSDFKHVTLGEENKGISWGSNRALDMIESARGTYDLVVKMDNDCLVQSEGILSHIADVYEEINERDFGPEYVLSPRVEGIVRQPVRERQTQIANRTIGLTAIVGGLFCVTPFPLFSTYRYPLDLPLASGQDDHFCHWVKRRGGEVGYIEDLVVEHYRGTDQQARDYPDYFRRKHEEEQRRP
jgi:glycosyltransferase involved in cell wall biosynthesis